MTVLHATSCVWTILNYLSFSVFSMKRTVNGIHISRVSSQRIFNPFRISPEYTHVYLACLLGQSQIYSFSGWSNFSSSNIEYIHATGVWTFKFSQKLTFWTLFIILFFYLKWHFGDRTLSPSSGKKPTQLDPINRASPNLWKPEATQDKIYKQSTTENFCRS
jgi:hypothetical protein